MRKKIFWPLGFFFLAFFVEKSCAQVIDAQLRYFSEIKGLYPRLDIELPVAKKITLCGGLSKDALEMIDMTATYRFCKSFRIESGFGYHKQNGLHFIFGGISEIETKKIESKIYVRGYVDHKSLWATEAEIFYKSKGKLWFGLMADLEYGKYFQRWAETTRNATLLHEQLLLAGFISKYRFSEKVNLHLFTLIGQQEIARVQHSTYKIGLALHLKNGTHHH